MNHRPSTSRAALAVLATLSVLWGCGAQQPGPRASSRPSTAVPTHAAFDGILRRHTRNDLVDYLAIRDHQWSELDAYLDDLATTDLTDLDREQKLAYYINLYNASMIHAVCERLHPDYSTSDNNWRVFDEKLVQTADGVISLNHLEHEIIRKRFAEPRIHVALVCGARSCPPIMNHAYTAEGLQDTIERNMKRFVADRTRNRIDDGKVALSRIFDWYKADFGGDRGLLGYIGRYTDVNVADAKVEFLEYSWELNMLPPEGRWVVASSPDGEESGQILQVLGERDGQLKVQRPFGKGVAWIPAAGTRPYSK